MIVRFSKIQKKITAEITKFKAETEFEKYRVIQDKQFISDYDRYLLELEENIKKKANKYLYE